MTEWIWQCLTSFLISLTDLRSFCKNVCNTNENKQKMLLPFSYNDRVCQKTDVLARGTKMYNLTILKDWLLSLTAGHSNLDLLWKCLSFKNSLIYIRKKKLREGKKESNQNLLPWDSKFKAGGGTVTELFGKYRNRIVSSYVVVRRKECTSKKSQKRKKGGKDKIRLFIRRSKGRWDLSKCLLMCSAFPIINTLLECLCKKINRVWAGVLWPSKKHPEKSWCSTLRTEMGLGNCGHCQGWRKPSEQSVGQKAKK